MTTMTPSVLFLCVHNAGRSQMAAGWLQHLAGDRVHVYSGGSEPASEVNAAAIAFGLIRLLYPHVTDAAQPDDPAAPEPS